MPLPPRDVDREHIYAEDLDLERHPRGRIDLDPAERVAVPSAGLDACDGVRRHLNIGVEIHEVTAARGGGGGCQRVEHLRDDRLAAAAAPRHRA